MAMTFYDTQDKQEQENYKTYLSLVCSLSRLFSDSNEPYLYYRAAENVFCKAFNADNLSRSDCSADAKKNKIGIGLKTFLHNNGRTLQKIAEFNSDRKNYVKYFEEPEKFIYHIAQLRNERIEFTKRTHDIENMIYHCVTRKNNSLNLYEMPMHLVDIDSIKLQKINATSISFKDKHNEYSFNISKSTLSKRFVMDCNTISIPIEILKDPIELLEQINSSKLLIKDKEYQRSIVLPLYSIKNDEKIVHERSALNQWNAKGRHRDYNEIYIPIPSWIHKNYNGFFPERDKAFNLVLPDKKNISSKVCQDNSKALMSNPNKLLGKWLLRDVLQLKEEELLTYEHLNRLGIDSVRIDKIEDNKYAINFAAVGTFDKFKDENKKV